MWPGSAVCWPSPSCPRWPASPARPTCIRTRSRPASAPRRSCPARSAPRAGCSPRSRSPTPSGWPARPVLPRRRNASIAASTRRHWSPASAQRLARSSPEPAPAGAAPVTAVASGSAEQLADAGDDLLTVQLDIGDELMVREAGHAVLQVEPGGAKGAEVGGDLLGDGLGGADVERPVRPGLPVERLLGGDREAALVGDEG